MKIFICMSHWRDEIVLHHEAFTSAAEAQAFCERELVKNLQSKGFVKCDVTELELAEEKPAENAIGHACGEIPPSPSSVDPKNA